ncbi:MULTISPECIES: alpha/beta hydrolase [Pseudomonas syringae group]|uniref:Alpha/beta hydrolase n=4 Tax=Pseudomonas syringae group TaxID=136849 RepID=A0AA40P6Q5_9PSED|nr:MULTISPECIES: dienelactone hydrolase family protein [Pseudomonas syringae group]KGS16259.1 phospholipase [Pseudomonas coronafaciens]KOP53934.1 phospholipase [Pseudomonas coronafaciens pv. porri]KOP58242.1 phospholipase [Pseudomonas coronafaciens pv. porri]KPB49976.1 Phospholipase/carboxylesterase family protein [Pseudomonas coronafaciens pv. oryzae]KPX29149.1 Phospholipase/carboxylesterase family protein [Pseudomonas coronafaciens pv. garcae]
MLKFFAALLFAVAGMAQAQDTLHTDLPLDYLAQANVETPNRPLVIFIHGYGSNAADLFGLKEHLPADYNYLSVQAPVTLQPDSYKWFTQKRGAPDYDGVTEDLKSSGTKLTAFITQATAKFHTQPDKVFLVGFSQGAMMSYEVALRQPKLVGGIAALSGRLLPVVQSEVKPSDDLKALKVFIGHGKQDRQVAYASGPQAEATLKSLGLTPQFHAYEGLGHSISEAEVVDLGNWLQQSAR